MTFHVALALSYEQISVREAGAVASAVETLGVIGPDSQIFLDLAFRIRKATMEPLAHQYLLQRISVVIQLGNAIAITGHS